MSQPGRLEPLTTFASASAEAPAGSTGKLLLARPVYKIKSGTADDLAIVPCILHPVPASKKSDVLAVKSRFF